MSSVNPIGFPFIELPEVESTNNYAMGLVHAGMAQHGSVVFTHDQTKGKGQRHKQWVSAPRKNITLSLIIEPFGLQINQQFLLSMAVAIGVQAFFNKYAGKTKIKWPNDIYFGDRKAGGILIENVIQGNEWKYAIVGIGLNINQERFGDFDNRAISLIQITGKTFNTVEMAKELINYLELSFKQLVKDPETIIHDYHKHLYKWKKKALLKKADLFFKATIKEVRIDGMLVVEHEKEEVFKVGEVEWV